MATISLLTLSFPSVLSTSSPLPCDSILESPSTSIPISALSPQSNPQTTFSSSTAPSSSPLPTLTSLPLSSSPIPLPTILSQITALEKHAFPKDEAMDFPTELKKRNTELFVILDPDPDPELALKTASAGAPGSGQRVRSLLDLTTPPPPPPPSNPPSKPPETAPANPSPNSHPSPAPPAAPPPLPPKALVAAYLLHSTHHSFSALHKLLVHPSYRRRGLASALLRLLQSHLTRRGVERCSLWVDPARHAAAELYSKCGFARRELVGGYYGRGRHGRRMEWKGVWAW